MSEHTKWPFGKIRVPRLPSEDDRRLLKSDSLHSELLKLYFDFSWEPESISLPEARSKDLSPSEKRILQDLESTSPSIESHFRLFCGGTHPFKQAFRRVSQLSEISLGVAISEQSIFAKLIYLLVFQYSQDGLTTQARDREYRIQFTRFRKSSHEFQHEIEELASQRGLDVEIDLLESEDGYLKFIGLAGDKENLRLVRRGLRSKSTASQLRKSRQQEKKARQEADAYCEHAAEALALAEANAERERLAKEALRRESKSRRRLEATLKRRDEAYLEAIKKARLLEGELSAAKSEEHRRQKQLGEFRREALAQVEQIRAQEISRISAGAQGMEVDPHFGLLMLEAWRVFGSELEEGEWKSRNDRLYFRVVERLLMESNPSERYLHPEGRNVVKSLNRYFGGELPLSEVVSLAQSTLSPILIAPRPVSGKQKHWAGNLVDSWIGPHRDYQKTMLLLYRQGIHPSQQDIAKRVESLNLPDRMNEDAWKRAWDQDPGIFVARLDSHGKEEHG